MESSIVFVRVGWMARYGNSDEPEPDPVGGGKFNLNNVGWEKNNFREKDGRYFGYFAVGKGSNSINLSKVNGLPTSRKADQVSNVLLIFIARQPNPDKSQGQYVVGWYRNAVLYRSHKERVGEKGPYRAETSEIVLVPESQRTCEIPNAKPGPGIGQSNIYYTRNSDGSKRDLPWLNSILEYVRQFPKEPSAEQAAAIEEERQAGFQSNVAIKDAVEQRAMDVVKERFRNFLLQNDSATES